MTFLRDIAPVYFQNYRFRRYCGDDLCLPLSRFTAGDQEIVRSLYRVLQRLVTILSAQSGNVLKELRKFLVEYPPNDLVDRIFPLGHATYLAAPSPQLAKTIHDVRGGGLSEILSRLQLIELGVFDLDMIIALYRLTRDHMKMMRNALLELDDVTRAEDLQTQIQTTEVIVEKWHGANLKRAGGELRVRVECPRTAGITECCIELGALNRIIYNMINNAARHSSSSVIRLVVFPVGENGQENIRFVVINHLNEIEAERLAVTDLRTLFSTGVSSTGSGYGLAVAADIVSQAYGLESARAAVEGQYLGAQLLGDELAVWFHWPSVAQAKTERPSIHADTMELQAAV